MLNKCFVASFRENYFFKFKIQQTFLLHLWTSPKFEGNIQKAQKYGVQSAECTYSLVCLV